MTMAHMKTQKPRTLPMTQSRTLAHPAKNTRTQAHLVTVEHSRTQAHFLQREHTSAGRRTTQCQESTGGSCPVALGHRNS